MKLYNKKDFLKLPGGTVYFEKPCNENGIPCLRVGELNIKWDSIGDVDFLYSNINTSWFKNCDSSEQHIELWEKVSEGQDIDLDFEDVLRDALYEDNAQYYVLNKDEVKEIIKVLTEAYDMAYKNKQE